MSNNSKLLSPIKNIVRAFKPKVISRAANMFSHRENISPKYYNIGVFKVKMPEKHGLPSYQAVHRLYDRFLPCLCAELAPDEAVIDVGANVGDTIAAIIQTCPNPILAIEGYPAYYEILRRNIDQMGQNHRVKAIQALIGRGKSSGALVPNNGTAKLEITDSGACVTLSLDDVLEDYKDIALIKVDTDGFDFDVIMSGINTIKRTQPLLFWEGGTTDTEKFKEMYGNLSAIGYNSFWVFDNFGNLMIENCSIRHLVDFDKYVESQYKFECTRTLYYTDVLASTEKTIEMARSAVLKYRRDRIESC